MSRFVDTYRPRSLSSVVGQDKVVAQLQGMLEEGKLGGNTLLLSGPYGTGKTTLARVLARTVNCAEGGISPCGKCRSCKTSIDAHPDVVEINAANTRGIDDIRNLIESSRLRPRNKMRVFIIDEIHQLTGPASQSFLKDLEEPKKHLLYILCTTEPYSLLPTIRSRSSWLKLKSVSPRDTVRLLKRVCKREELTIGSSVLKYLAELSDGHVRDALTMLDQLAASPELSSLSEEELKEALPELSEGILGSSPVHLVPKFVQGMLSGDLSPLIHIRKVDNHDYFVGLVVKFVKEYLIYTLNPAAVDNKTVSSFAKAQGKVSSTRLLVMLESLLTLQERLKRHSLDPLDAFDATVLRFKLVK